MIKNCPHGAGYRYGNYDINSDKPTEYWCARCEEGRLRKQNETLLDAIYALANPGSYFNTSGRPTGQHGIEWLATGHDTPWEYAAWVRDQVEKGE